MPLDRRSGWALVEFTDDEAKALDYMSARSHLRLFSNGERGAR